MKEQDTIQWYDPAILSKISNMTLRARNAPRESASSRYARPASVSSGQEARRSIPSAPTIQATSAT